MPMRSNCLDVTGLHILFENYSTRGGLVGKNIEAGTTKVGIFVERN